MPSKKPASADVKIEKVSKTFHTAKRTLHVLRDVSMKADAGTITCIVGKSGCGKSTLLRVVAGLETANEGTVKLGGEILKAPGRDRGVVFQDPRLLPWLTVEKNIAFALQGLTDYEVKRRVVQYLKKVGLLKAAKHYPHQLSGGMAQRVAIARGLVNQPKVLLLDEPFGALDALTRIQMQQEILHLWESLKPTMIMVTHDIDEAVFLGDQVIVMSSGANTIRKRLSINLPRPRDRSSPAFQSLRKEILAEFFDEA